MRADLDLSRFQDNHPFMTQRPRKSIYWCGNSLECLKAFSDVARQRAGLELSKVQAGGEPSDWKPMDAVGKGVREIRIHGENAYRVMYVAKFAQTIYVLHAFEKKSQRTSRTDLDISSRRYRDLLRSRSQDD